MAALSIASHKNYWFGFLFYGGLVLFAVAVVAFNLFRPVTVLPRITLAPGYALTNSSGRSLTSEDLRGGLSLYSFSYSRCAGEHCPNLAEVQGLLNKQQVTDLPLSLVTISLDPEWDSPAVLANYLQQNGYDGSGRNHWHFLTGDSFLVRTVVGNGFSLYYKAEGDGQIKFEPRFVLVDGLGVIRAYYYGSRPEPAILLRDIRLVSEEAQNSHGATRLAYEAAHLFLCYPH